MGSWASCDFSAIKELSKRMHELADPAEIDAFFIDCLNNMTDGTLDAVMDKTPPIITGNLLNGWRRSKVKKWRGAYQTEIYNNVEYAPWVENGHRNRLNKKTGLRKPPVEGRFMLRDSVQEAQDKAPAYLERKQRAFLSRLEGK